MKESKQNQTASIQLTEKVNKNHMDAQAPRLYFTSRTIGIMLALIGLGAWVAISFFSNGFLLYEILPCAAIILAVLFFRIAEPDAPVVKNHPKKES